MLSNALANSSNYPKSRLRYSNRNGLNWNYGVLVLNTLWLYARRTLRRRQQFCRDSNGNLVFGACYGLEGLERVAQSIMRLALQVDDDEPPLVDEATCHLEGKPGTSGSCSYRTSERLLVVLDKGL